MSKKAPSKEETTQISTELIAFMTGLASEGERALIIGGAARVEVALERLLKSVTVQNPPEGKDELFDVDRPLGNFSAKISLAHRLGLLDDDLEQALHIIRKVRNHFAHATTLVSLSQSPDHERILEVLKRVKKSDFYHKGINTILAMNPEENKHLEFGQSIVLGLAFITIELEIASWINEPCNFRVAKMTDVI